MLSVPLRLLEESFITKILISDDITILKKELNVNALDRHSYISDHVALFVQYGEQLFDTYEGSHFKVRAGEIALIKRGMYTTSDLVAGDKGFRSYLIFFNDQILQQAIDLHEGESVTEVRKDEKLIFKAGKSVVQYYQQLEQLKSTLVSETNAIVTLKALEFFALLIAEDPHVRSDLVGLQISESRDLSNFMKQHFDKPLQVADYAYMTGRSESTFRREFNLKFGMSPVKWLTQRRLEKAQQLLKSGSKSITQAAYDVGYDNISHFIKLYKNEYGSTPKQHLQTTPD